MSVDVKLRGMLEFEDDAGLLDDALRELAESLDGEEDEFQELLEEEGWLTAAEQEIRIDFEASIPADWFLGLDSMVEALCDYASGGEVRCWYEGEEMDPYTP